MNERKWLEDDDKWMCRFFPYTPPSTPFCDEKQPNPMLKAKTTNSRAMTGIIVLFTSFASFGYSKKLIFSDCMDGGNLFTIFLEFFLDMFFFFFKYETSGNI